MLIISTAVRQKISKKNPPVTEEEIKQAFANREGNYLTDKREEHATNPPTLWFIAETNKGKRLKVCFIDTGTDIVIKSAYVPNDDENRIYTKFA